MPKRRARDVSDADIVAAYAKLRSSPKVADLLGIGITTINRALVKAGIERTGLDEFRASGSLKGNDYRPYKGSTDQILRWYADGLSMRSIAAKIGRSTHVVMRRVKAAGISRPWQGRGPQHSMWKGGRVRAHEGYMRVWVSEHDKYVSMRNQHGYVLEHRLVMAKRLGRPLLPTETVHHVNGDKMDNRLKNLELRQGKHGKHVVMCCLDCGSTNVGPRGLK